MSVIDYTNVDYKGFKNMMVTTLQELLPNYTDTSETDAGMVIMEALSRVMDILNYYQNVQANECFLTTAELRNNILKWCKMLGYTPRPCTPAKYKQHFVIKSNSGRVKIPKGTILRTKEKTADKAVFFTTLEDLSVLTDTETNAKSCKYYIKSFTDSTGTYYVYEIDIAHGTLVSNEVLGTGDGITESQSFTLSNSPVSLPEYDDEGRALMPVKDIDNNIVSVPDGYDESRSFTLSVSGKEWSLVNSFIDSTSYDTHYTVEVLQDNTVNVIFGDGTNGKIPKGEISVSYRNGGGTIGNVGAKTITIMTSRINGVKETFNPDLAYMLGGDKETVKEIKINAPNANRTKWGCIQSEDYADKVIELFPQIMLASSFPKSERFSVDLEHPTEQAMHIVDTIQICVVPSGSVLNDDGTYKTLEEFGNISDKKFEILYTSIMSRLNERALVGTFIELSTFEPKKVILNCTLLPVAGQDFDTVSGRVIDYLKDYFAIGQIQPGATLSLNELEGDVYADIKGVRAFRINSYTSNGQSSTTLSIPSELWEIIELDTVDILTVEG